jgi:hypothetical protein
MLAENAHDLTLLQRVVKENSVSKNWNEIVKEWYLSHVFKQANGKCICGVAIVDHCIIKNLITGTTLTVGNTCVEKFNPELAYISKPLFRAMSDMGKNTKTRASGKLLEYCIEKRILDTKWAEVYISFGRKRKLSVKQEDLISNLNKSILIAFSKPTMNCDKCHGIVYAKESKKKEIYYRCVDCDCFLQSVIVSAPRQ